MIYKMISLKLGITIKEMSEQIGISDRQTQKYVKRLMELNMITREGGRKNGEWKIIDEEYEGTKVLPKREFLIILRLIRKPIAMGGRGTILLMSAI